MLLTEIEHEIVATIIRFFIAFLYAAVFSPT